MKNYAFATIEKKWHEKWKTTHLFDARIDHGKPKFYALVEFPYPSGAGLHVGHARPFTAMDIIARKRRMQGFNVLFPIGFDSFGLPTENYAIKTGIRPEIATEQNVANFKKQLESIGFSFSWNSEIWTSRPDYYKWTQWLFIQMFKEGLAYKADEEIWWCPTCKIGVANEELEAGRCERCGADVVKKTKPTWCFKMQSYSDKLIEGLERVDYPENVKKMQSDWIGKSSGAEVEFALSNGGSLGIYTTRPDTIDGVEFMVLSPEKAYDFLDFIENADEVRAYIDRAVARTDVERAQAKLKTGVPCKGLTATNPSNGRTVPVFAADYVLGKYGTGAIMAVPDLDERDGEFAAAMGIEFGSTNLLSQDESLKIGKRKVNYKMNDWQFSRQRYWGEPIPMAYCKNCGWQPLPESELPLILPAVDDYLPTDDGLSPLARLDDWVKCKCPKCGGVATRETDTMPNWAGSCWYFLRYMDPENSAAFASKEALDYWGQVDWYTGGQEHVTRHLLYSRFWHKALFDAGLVPYDEPYKKRSLCGMILAENGIKMSKSKGNVVNPDEIIAQYGADTLRTYEMFIGPFDQAAAWSTTALIGVHRFLARAFAMTERVVSRAPTNEEKRTIAQCIKHVSERIEQMKFNTAISALMIALNFMEANGEAPKALFADYAKLLSPFAPHLADEIWESLGEEAPLAFEPWPTFDPADAESDKAAYVIQINGKKRMELELDRGLDPDTIEDKILDDPALAPFLCGKKVRRVVVVPEKLVNVVV
jgi:leucyl-tRNA synthetase